MSEIETKPVEVLALFDSGEKWADRYRIVLDVEGERYAIASGEYYLRAVDDVVEAVEAGATDAHR